jgi:hypothetical protein
MRSSGSRVSRSVCSSALRKSNAQWLVVTHHAEIRRPAATAARREPGRNCVALRAAMSCSPQKEAAGGRAARAASRMIVASMSAVAHTSFRSSTANCLFARGRPLRGAGFLCRAATARVEHPQA